MKKIISFLASIILLVVFFQSIIFGQDPANVGSKVYKQLLDNERIIAYEVTFRINVVGGETQIAEVKKGNYLWGKGVTHSAKNIGNTELKAVLVEIKD